jgi:hypothetical protein
MRISVEATKHDLEPALNWLAGYVGSGVKQRIGNYEKHTKRDPLLAEHFRRTHALEYALFNACKYRRNTGRTPKGSEYDALYAFAVPAMRIHERLPESGRRPFEGKLQDFVSGTYGARPFAYEVGIATHLMQKGWDVEFADLCGSARFDFLGRLGTAEIEIECKTTSGDTGRKIHRQEVNRLADMLTPVTEALLEDPGCYLLRIAIPDRLGKSPGELAALVELVRSGIETGHIHDARGEVTYRKEDATTWPEPKGDDDAVARDFFEKRLGTPNCHLFFNGRPGHAIVGASITSRKPDKVVAALASEAVHAAKQCSGTRPAIVAMHLIDPIDREGWSELLRTQNGLHKIAHAVFKNEARAHVDSIMFSTPQQRLTQVSTGAHQMSAPVLVLNNNKAKYAADAVRSVFRDAPAG